MLVEVKSERRDCETTEKGWEEEGRCEEDRYRSGNGGTDWVEMGWEEDGRGSEETDWFEARTCWGEGAVGVPSVGLK